MRRVIYWVHVSADGRINGPSGEFDWPVIGGGGLFAYSEELTDRTGTFLYGGAVWDIMVPFWPIAETISQDDHTLKFAPIWRARPKVVVTRDPSKVEGASVLSSPEEVAKLKAEPGEDILLTGGSGLAAELTELGLIDEFHFAIHPVVLGGGLPLLPGVSRSSLTLKNSQTLESGVVILHYE